MRPIFFWADGTWCEARELESTLAWKSDDFAVIYVPEDLPDSRVDVLVFERAS